MPLRAGQTVRIKKLDGSVVKMKVKGVKKQRAAPKAKSTFAKKVLAIVARKGETKMVAENILTPATAVPQFQATPANLARMVPRLGQGAGDYQRIGDKISPTSARTLFTVYPADTTLNLYDITVNLLILKVKGAATDTAVAAIPGQDLLRVGDGTNTDPTGYTPEQMLTLINHYPVNTERYTVLKHFRHRFCKGPNSINGPVGAGGNNAPPTAGPALPAKTFVYSWKPPALSYDNGAANLPTNHYPCYVIWATANDASAYVGNVKFAVRSELYFKDS